MEPNGLLSTTLERAITSVVTEPWSSYVTEVLLPMSDSGHSQPSQKIRQHTSQVARQGQSAEDGPTIEEVD